MPRKSNINPTWQKRFRIIPGYDPSTHAGDCRFDPNEAEHAIKWIEGICTHVKGVKGSQPFMLEEWQKAVVGCIFGWKRPDRTRRYREVFLFVPRKNGKTQICAAIVLYVLCNDNEPGMEIYSAAAEREQASLVYAHAQGMVLQESELSSRLNVYKTVRSIVNEATFSSYKVISADAESKHGFNSHCIIIDETHAQPNRELVDVLTTSTGARRQPLIIHATTSDYERPSICNEKHDYACKVRDGIINDFSFLPVIYEASIDDDWTSPKVWQRVNPNLGVSISLEYLERECKRAIETPAYQNTFKRLHLNIRTEQDIRWIAIEDWDACQGEVDIEALAGKRCYAGLDLAATSDLCALILYFPKEGKRVLPFFWLPRETALKRQERARVPYPEWVHAGYIRVTEGNVADYDVIREDILALREKYNIVELAIDTWNSTHLQTQLGKAGIEVVPFGQGFASMAAPSKEFERLILAKEIVHDGHPVLRWNVSNVMAETDAAGNLKPSKKKSHEKIDGVVSLIMAIGRAMVEEGPEGPSIYESRGIVVL